MVFLGKHSRIFFGQNAQLGFNSCRIKLSVEKGLLVLRTGLELTSFQKTNAGVAQRLERHVANVNVGGSNPLTRSFKLWRQKWRQSFFIDSVFHVSLNNRETVNLSGFRCLGNEDLSY